MASYNSAHYVGDALRSALAQTLRDIEIVVVDDGSTDGSAEIVAAAAVRDSRVRLVRSMVRGGPAIARNLGLDQARGRWIAVMDSDDLIHPRRLEHLLQLAEAHGSDIAADNLLIFDDDAAVPPQVFDPALVTPRTVSLADYVLANAYGRAGPKSGYLKPLIRAAFIQGCGARYQPTLLVAQDFSFVRLLLAAGATFHVFPETMYFYRRHAGSNSHRLARSHIEAMLADDTQFLARLPFRAADVLQAFAARSQGFQRALAFDDLVQALKTRRWRRAAAVAMRQPRAALQLWQPLANRLARWRRRPAVAPLGDGVPRVCLLGSAPATALRELSGWFTAGGAEAHLVAVPGDRGQAPPGSLSTAAQLFIARHARPLADVIVVAGIAGIDWVPSVLRPRSPALVLVDAAVQQQPAGLSRADAILTHRPLAAALRAACPDTPIVLLASRSLYDGVGLPAGLAGLAIRSAQRHAP